MNLVKKLRDMHGLAADSCDPEFNRAILDAANEIERLWQQIEDAEIGLLTWDNGRNSEYWLRYPERLGDEEPGQQPR